MGEVVGKIKRGVGGLIFKRANLILMIRMFVLVFFFYVFVVV